MAVGSRLRQIRHERGLTIDDLVATTAISNPYLSKVERDLALPHPDTFRLIAEGLEVPDEVAEELLRELLYERDRTELEKLGFPSSVAHLAATLNRLDEETREEVVDGALRHLSEVIGDQDLRTGADRDGLSRGTGSPD